ncbi:thioredoxin domain-containing protein [Corynebacterium variabile]|uniref:thioredoxin domain-containing protein n=1 Tax=Corynebacterium variabile TaxID=1727 RepID=UPI00264959A9|nr:thioredoxin domain-containing protein [Corynebacterium variabile]MDN6660698.1 thioredoxin domain-containing protein [Corynebacterium variabile]MDN6676431.1 thioredoxin domain-containing protein [Corynebacterium variabile]MDN6845039.1 thioredoxin domain-containing protein [Corynebacterium variabile]
MSSTPNRLADSTSPYLRQHADNPVDWWPWGPEAFAEARRRDVPVFLSIGYATCHWCHVMARESFSDPDIAAQINAGFVAVKVDREQHPGVDAVYMQATQALTGQGGWPMTVVTDADGRPFFAGTYFRPDQLTQLLAALVRTWREDRTQVDAVAGRLTAALAAASEEGGSRPGTPTRTPRRSRRGSSPPVPGWSRVHRRSRRRLRCWAWSATPSRRAHRTPR